MQSVYSKTCFREIINVLRACFGNDCTALEIAWTTFLSCGSSGHLFPFPPSLYNSNSPIPNFNFFLRPSTFALGCLTFDFIHQYSIYPFDIFRYMPGNVRNAPYGVRNVFYSVRNIFYSVRNTYYSVRNAFSTFRWTCGVPVGTDRDCLTQMEQSPGTTLPSQSNARQAGLLIWFTTIDYQ